MRKLSLSEIKIEKKWKRGELLRLERCIVEQSDTPKLEEGEISAGESVVSLNEKNVEEAEETEEPPSTA